MKREHWLMLLIGVIFIPAVVWFFTLPDRIMVQQYEKRLQAEQEALHKSGIELSIDEIRHLRPRVVIGHDGKARIVSPE